MPDFEIEVKSDKDKGQDTLKPAKWAGTAHPTYGDGKEYKINAK